MDERSIEQRVAEMHGDPAIDLVLDGNAIAGLLMDVFDREVTSLATRCRHCATVSVVGTLRVYMRGPGVVIRCPSCTEVMLRFAKAPAGMRVDMSGQDDLQMAGG